MGTCWRPKRCKNISKLNWSRRPEAGVDPFFTHTLVVSGKVLSSPTNFEPAGDDLAEVAKGKDPAAVLADRAKKVTDALLAQIEDAEPDAPAA